MEGQKIQNIPGMFLVTELQLGTGAQCRAGINFSSSFAILKDFFQLTWASKSPQLLGGKLPSSL